ncbi:hypothetical protein E2C01_028513 [Portunus trituberculatus]|uniref:Uncharacterized protein n=1 Tax=Portunus trituberculatus TaxID=210409 RepID=A0A5B7EPN2_PORTR|nr:hypothetical protein [Portunus trituberculatus]
MLYRGKALYRPPLAATTYPRQITVCAEVARQSGTTWPPHLRPLLPSTLQAGVSFIEKSFFFTSLPITCQPTVSSLSVSRAESQQHYARTSGPGLVTPGVNVRRICSNLEEEEEEEKEEEKRKR